MSNHHLGSADDRAGHGAKGFGWPLALAVILVVPASGLLFKEWAQTLDYGPADQRARDYVRSTVLGCAALVVGLPALGALVGLGVRRRRPAGARARATAVGMLAGSLPVGAVTLLYVLISLAWGERL